MYAPCTRVQLSYSDIVVQHLHARLARALHDHAPSLKLAVVRDTVDDNEKKFSDGDGHVSSCL